MRKFTFFLSLILLFSFQLSAQDCQNYVHSFDGKDDYVEYSGIQMNYDIFTIGLWFNAGTVENGRVEDRFFSFGTDRRLEVGIETSGNLWLFDYSYGQKELPMYVRDGNWHQLVYVKNGSYGKLILDNEVVMEYETTASYNGYGQTLRLGSWAGSVSDGGTYIGLMDDFVLYDSYIEIDDYCKNLGYQDILPVIANDFENLNTSNPEQPYYASQGRLDLPGYVINGDGLSSRVCKPFEKDCDSFTQGCEGCSTDYLNLSTGMNPVTGNRISVGKNPYWTVIDGPQDDRETYPRSSYIIYPNGAWNNTSIEAQYISPIETGRNYEFYEKPYVLEQAFSVCDYSDMQVNVKALFDNILKMELVSGGQVIHTFFDIDVISTSTFNTPSTGSWAGTAEAGEYALRAYLKNDGVVAMGMAIQAEIQGSALKKIECRDDYDKGQVSGYVICEDFEEGSVQDVIIELVDANGSIETTTTDVNGFFEFRDLPEGSYIIQVVNIEAQPQQYSFTIMGEENSYYFNFNSCYHQECCVDQEYLYQVMYSIDEYHLSFSDNIITIDLAELYNMACDAQLLVEWGDGSSEEGLIEPYISHAYNQSGVYNIYISYIAYGNNGICAEGATSVKLAINVCEDDEGLNQAPEDIHYNLHPNPATLDLTINLSSNDHGYDLQVYDVKGHLVLEGNIKKGSLRPSVDISTLREGMYQLILESKETRLSSRFIKMR